MTTEFLTNATPEARRLRATGIGGLAILLWSSLALLTTLAGPVPPFQLVAMSFGVAGAASLAIGAVQGRTIERLRHPPAVWLLGIGGLFGYHFLYFLALGSAPPVEANLINYLWPLLIVVFAGFLPGERLRWWHLAGAFSGLVGAVILVTHGFQASIGQGGRLGYAAALAAAVIWAGYSVLSRRFGAVPSEAIGGFCAATSVLAALCHFLLEPTTWPVGGTAWLAVLGLGIGPVGIAFFAWDHGVKHGNIKALGGLSYATPLLSTLALIAAGRGIATASLGLACLMIVGGAGLAARDLWMKAN
jgi:drug/metabolite transporter (DMT)-like permease